MMTRDELLAKLSAMDFYAIDMQLYLNTHPEDREALMIYNNIVMEAKALREEYESQFGMLMAMGPSKYPWQWINNPWPWQAKFNFKLAGDDK